METRTTTGQVKIASGLNVLLGIWLFIAPFLLGYSDVAAALWNDIIVGAIVLILAGIRVWKPMHNRWLSWTNVLLGIWLAIAPFILGYTEITAALWNDIIVGVAIIILGAWSAIVTPETA
jgi:hypothetical protein